MRKRSLKKEINKMLEDDQISDAEAGFMMGYLDE